MSSNDGAKVNTSLKAMEAKYKDASRHLTYLLEDIDVLKKKVEKLKSENTLLT